LQLSLTLKSKSKPFTIRNVNRLSFLVLPFFVLCLSLLFSRDNFFLWGYLYYIIAGGGLISSVVMAFNNFSTKTFINNDGNINTKNLWPPFFTAIDLGIIYFGLQLIALAIFPNALSILYITSLFATIFPIYSIYKQAVVIKKISPLCLVVITILILQAIISFQIRLPFNDEKNILLLLLLLLLIVSLTWISLRTLLNRHIALQKIERNFLVIRRDRDFLNLYYKNQRILDDEPITSIPSITVGKATALVYILLIIDPINENSKQYFTTIYNLLSVYPKMIFLRVVFNTMSSKDKKLSEILSYWIYNAFAVNSQTGLRFLLKILESNNRAIEKEYSHLKIQPDSHEIEFLKIHEGWCSQNNLLNVPTVLINNRAYPMIYDASDLRHYMEDIILSND
jgi:hypothetical protein